jgi:hypothetical protein
MKKKPYPKECFTCSTFEWCLISSNKRPTCPCRHCLIQVMCMSACDPFKDFKNMGFVGNRIVIHKSSAEL